MQNEYYTSSEISKITGLNQRQITYRIRKINATKELIHKSKIGEYKIHRLLLPRFKMKEKKVLESYAYSSDLPRGYTAKEIKEAMGFVLSLCAQYTKLEYSIEQKNKQGDLHIHSVLTTENKNDFVKNMKAVLGSQSYKFKTLFDRDLWLSYCTKYDTDLIIITNKKTD